MQMIHRLFFFTGGLLLLSGSVFAGVPATHLYMPDGQILSHPIRVYVTPDIVESLDPRLRLTGSHEVKKKILKKTNCSSLLFTRQTRTGRKPSPGRRSAGSARSYFSI